MFNRIALLILLAVYCCSCRPYQSVSKAWWRSQGSYNQEDTLYVKDFILCYSRKEPDDEIFDYFPRKRMSTINEDSVFNVFTSALHKLDLPVSILKDSENRCDASFHRQHPPKLWKINNKEVKEIANLGEHKTVLLPFLRIDQHWNIIVRGDPAMSAKTQKISWLDIIILMVKDERIIYRKQYRKSESELLDGTSEPYPTIKQDVWDELVRLTMEDYMKRMK